jgi:hypothetical protein
MANGTALAALLELVQASGGSVVTEFDFKSRLICSRRLEPRPFDGTALATHHYGPFSRELSGHAAICRFGWLA